MCSTFLAAYRKLDGLCKNLFAGDYGISAYVDSMEAASHDMSCAVLGWKEDYNKLKYLLRMDANFVNGICTDADFDSQSDIEWMEHFISRITSSDDPLSGLRRSVASPPMPQPISRNEKRRLSVLGWVIPLVACVSLSFVFGILRLLYYFL